MTVAGTAPRITISEQTARDAQVPAQRGVSLVLRDAEGRDVVLPSRVSGMLLDVLAAIAEHGSVTISQVPEELTSTAAADLLGVSRPTVLRWAREGAIESFRVGTHTRFRRQDVVRLRAEQEEKRRSAFRELRELDADGDFEYFTS